MNRVVWKDSYSVGSAEIDNQHQRLFELVNRLIDVTQSGGDRARLGTALDDTFDYLDVHFKTEEALLKRCGYPEFDAHRAKHARFVRQALGFQWRFRRQEADVDARMLDFLGDWLVRHVCGTDVKYVPYLLRSPNALDAA